jgi:hypothetical protein
MRRRKIFAAPGKNPSLERFSSWRSGGEAGASRTQPRPPLLLSPAATPSRKLLLSSFVENPAVAPRERDPFVVVASLHRPLGGCIAVQRLWRATTATTATMQRSWDRQGQTPTCSAVVAIVASLHATMQRPIVASHDATTWGQTMTTWPAANPAEQAPDRGFRQSPLESELSKTSRPAPRTVAPGPLRRPGQKPGAPAGRARRFG